MITYKKKSILIHYFALSIPVNKATAAFSCLYRVASDRAENLAQYENVAVENGVNNAR